MAAMSLIAREAPPGSVRFVRDDLLELIVSFDDQGGSVILLVIDARGCRLLEANVEALAGCAYEFEQHI